MKKFFLIPLLTLMCSVMAWGTNVANWDELMAAVATPNASVTLTADINIPGGTHNFNYATIACGAYKLTGATEGVIYVLRNATIASTVSSSNSIISITAGDSVSLENIDASNLNRPCVYSNPNVRIDANSNISVGNQRSAVTLGKNYIKFYNYGTITGVNTSGRAVNIYNYGTINPAPNGSIGPNAFYVSQNTVNIHNYGTISGKAYVYGAGTINFNNYSIGIVNNGVEISSANTTEAHLGKGGVNIVNEGSFTQTERINMGSLSFTNNGTATIQNGTFIKSTQNNKAKWELKGSQPIHIYVGTGTHFVNTPSGSNAIIHPNCIFDEGVGNHTIETGYMWRESDGMIVEMPHNVAEITHANSTVEYSEDLYEALTTAADGDIIKMIDDATLNYTARLNINSSIAAKHLTLDINGHEMRAITSVVPTLELYGGSLNIINSKPGEGGIYNEATSAIAINVYGSVLKNCNPRTAAIEDLYTYLNVAEGVNIYATTSGSSAIVVNHATKYIENNVVINKGTEIYENYVASGTGSHAGVANGVRVDVHGSLSAQKYAFKVNGTVAYPDATKVSTKTGQTYGEYFETVKEDFYGPGTTETISVGDTAYSPYIHIYSTAVLDADHTSNGAAGVYASGYARFDIEGTCKGAAGVYVKSGVVNLNEANIQSTWTQTATITPGKKSSITVGGHALVLESNNAYSGHTVLNVSGDTYVSTLAPEGIALFEVVANTTSKIDAISIFGGHFTGKYAMALNAATVDANKVTVYGVTATANSSVSTEATINPLLAAGTHTTVFDNDDETTTVIVSKGSAPSAVITDFGSSDNPKEGEVVDLPDRTDARWTGTEPGEISNGTTVTLGELQIISATGSDVQQLTIENNAALVVSRLIMNDNARIIVEAGGKLVVDGEQGINSPEGANIQLNTSESEQAVFLLHPEVTSNRHPMAKVELISKAYKRGENDYVWQRFGVPAYMEGITRGSMVYDHTEFPTSVLKLDYEHNQWTPMANDDEFVPFRCYELTTNADHAGAIYTFECPLMGNGDAELKLEGKWNYYANSYTAPIDIAQMIKDFADQNPNVSATVYLYRAIDNWWYEINNANLGETGVPTQIAPMQAFIFQRLSEGENPQVDYARQIWNPIMDPGANLAPSRRAASSLKKAVIEITAADGTKDAIRLIEGDDFSAGFDNSYDAEKYMNGESFNLYADANEPMAILATDDLEGTTLGMTTKEQTSFTMTISNVNGMNYAVRDNLTGTEMEMVEGATYMFSVPANTSVEGRFQIVPIAKMPTAIENIEETAAVKGIYTITGQFVGNDYHSLPNGVYVVDGKKIVK